MTKGIMFNCLKLMEKIFIEQKLNALTADIDAKNIPSIKFVEKIIFKKCSALFVISADSKTMCHFYTYKKIFMIINVMIWKRCFSNLLL